MRITEWASRNHPTSGVEWRKGADWGDGGGGRVDGWKNKTSFFVCVRVCHNGTGFSRCLSFFSEKKTWLLCTCIYKYLSTAICCYERGGGRHTHTMSPRWGLSPSFFFFFFLCTVLVFVSHYYSSRFNSRRDETPLLAVAQHSAVCLRGDDDNDARHGWRSFSIKRTNKNWPSLLFCVTTRSRFFFQVSRPTVHKKKKKKNERRRTWSSSSSSHSSVLNAAETRVLTVARHQISFFFPSSGSKVVRSSPWW